jgi:hypothetical protein
VADADPDATRRLTQALANLDATRRQLEAIEHTLRETEVRAILLAMGPHLADDARAEAQAIAEQMARLRAECEAYRRDIARDLATTPAELAGLAREERDAYVYREYAAGTPWPRIVRAVMDHPYWPKARADALRDAADTHAARNGLPPPPRRPPGRRGGR